MTVDMRPLHLALLTLFDGPGQPRGVEGAGERRLRLVPELNLAEVALGPRGERQGVVQAEHPVYFTEELEEALDLLHDLLV